MIFNSLRINNYRAYYGESIFDFPIEGERNINILYADIRVFEPLAVDEELIAAICCRGKTKVSAIAVVVVL